MRRVGTFLALVVVTILLLQTQSFEQHTTVGNSVIANQVEQTGTINVNTSILSSKPKLGIADSRWIARSIPAGGTLQRDWTERQSLGNFHLLPDCSKVLRQCVKPCVCYQCSESHDFIVDCSAKSLPFIPKGIPGNVTHLILRDNTISRVPSSSLERLKSLQVLDLSNNKISRLENASFIGLSSLRHLSMNHNSFNLSSDSFPLAVFRPLKSVTVLNLKSNQITNEANYRYLDSEIGELTSLEELYLDGVSHAKFGIAYGKLHRLNLIDLSSSKYLQYLGNDTFTSLTNIPVKTLNISHSDVKIIHPNTFKPLTNIDTLDLSYNLELELNNAGKSFAGLKYSPIRRIFAQRVHREPILTSLLVEDVKYLKHTKLEELYLDNNTIAQVESGLSTVIPPSLRVFSISWNDIQTYKGQPLEILRWKNLEYFYASYQEVYVTGNENVNGQPNIAERISEFTFQRSINVSFLNNFPQFGKLSASGGLSFPLPHNLTKVLISHTYKLRFTIPELRLHAPKLNKIDLSYNLLQRWKGPIKGLESVEEVDLSGNACYELTSVFFLHFESLQRLKLGDNLLGPVLEDGVFDGLSSLRSLDIHKNNLEHITPKLFTNLGQLKTLDLSRNSINLWDSKISHLKNLAWLDLTTNKLSSLPQELLEDLDEITQHNNISISLKDNPLVCNCDTKYFLHWLQNTRVKVLNEKSTHCMLENGSQIDLAGPSLKAIYNAMDTHCRTYTILTAVSYCIIVIVVGVTSGKILHRYRWKLRYMYYMAVDRGERTGYERLDGDDREHFTFDAFVSYEDSDRDFVRLDMLPRIETEAELRLCIDKRDFIPGFYITDNIMNAIENSRKTVVLLSKRFLQSKWCMYEFHMARMEGIYSDRHSLLVVLMEEIPANQLPVEVLEILHSKSYIRKTDDPDGTTLFWRQLTTGIRRSRTGEGVVI